MRIRFVQGTFQSAKVLVSTRAPSAPPPDTGGGNLPRSVASSADGTVVTTMPISGSGEFVYSFNVDFPEAGAGLPAQVLGGSLSSGMTWHPNGTFYIAGQNAICGGDPSSLLLIRPEGAVCLPGGQLFSSDYDVAASTVVPSPTRRGQMGCGVNEPQTSRESGKVIATNETSPVVCDLP